MIVQKNSFSKIIIADPCNIEYLKLQAWVLVNANVYCMERIEL
jgi:hypothetical protein